uniref:NUC153 domain-containing protein n=1 Tax=Labrus bergylta TaxID=56723 RepID=A0A3Q3EP18_9LABR
MALLMEDEGDEAKHKHFNYDKIVEQQNLSQKKKKLLKKKGEELQQEDQFQVDVKDPRFQAMFTSHLFNLDPSHPGADRKQVAGKKREKDRDAAAAVDLTSKKAMDPSLSMLVKSIKSKTEQFQARKKQKLV